MQFFEKQGLWLYGQGIFSVSNLQWLFPTLNRYQVGNGWNTRVNARNIYNPQSGAFDGNWMPDGSSAPDLRDADP